jgi:beta-lactamase superfamily II metal-dependent hydrolase
MPLTLTMHPGSDGDALTLTWGDQGSPARHALIDLGRTADYKALRSWLAQTKEIALFVVTHIDADHIEGAMPLAAEHQPLMTPADVWFNAHDHLKLARDRLRQHEVLSVLQGEKLSRAIKNFGWPWNAAFGGGPVSTDSPEAAAPIDVQGLKVTLLSPSDHELSALEKDWDRALADASLRLGDADEAPPAPQGLERLSAPDVAALAAAPMKPDRATPNGSSIAFLAEFDGRVVLMGADAHPGVMERKLAAMGYGPANRLRLDLFKVSHHGSRGNLSPGLLQLLDCTRFAFSTDGTRHHFPDPETVARILAADPGRDKVLYFNFRQKQALTWDVPALQARWRYSVVMPAEGHEGLAIDA